jgi:hypothetical protein
MASGTTLTTVTFLRFPSRKLQIRLVAAMALNTVYMVMYTETCELAPLDVPATVREQVRLETEKLIQE